MNGDIKNICTYTTRSLDFYYLSQMTRTKQKHFNRKPYKRKFVWTNTFNYVL